MSVRGRARGIPKDPVKLWLDMSEDPAWVYTEANAFPLSPVNGQRCFRTDIRGGMLFRYNASLGYWLSDQLFTDTLTSFASITATTGYYWAPSSDYDLWLTRAICAVFQTTTGAVNFFVATIGKRTPANANTNIWTQSFTAITVNTWTAYDSVLAYLLQPSSHPILAIDLTETGASTIHGAIGISYRLRAV